MKLIYYTFLGPVSPQTVTQDRITVIVPRASEQWPGYLPTPRQTLRLTQVMFDAPDRYTGVGRDSIKTLKPQGRMLVTWPRKNDLITYPPPWEYFHIHSFW